MGQLDTLIGELQKNHEIYKRSLNQEQDLLFASLLPLTRELQKFHIRTSLSESLLMFGKDFAQSVLDGDTDDYSEQELTALVFFTL